jgi:hypothetical protein
MGGVSAHNLDATVHVCISGHAGSWQGLCFARVLIRLRTVILTSMALIFLSCFFAFAIPPFPRRILLWQPDFPSGFRGNGFYL